MVAPSLNIFRVFESALILKMGGWPGVVVKSTCLSPRRSRARPSVRRSDLWKIFPLIRKDSVLWGAHSISDHRTTTRTWNSLYRLFFYFIINSVTSISQQTNKKLYDICTTSVPDVGPALYKCFTNVLHLLGRHPNHGRVDSRCRCRNQNQYWSWYQFSRQLGAESLRS